MDPGTGQDGALLGRMLGSYRIARLLGRPGRAALPESHGRSHQKFFSDGLTDETITQLGRLHPQRLSVIARTSSMRHKQGQAAIDTLGRELGVDYLLEGSARREGSRVRISATLIQVRDQTQRWTNTFEREVSGVLTLQNDVARGVAESLQLTLLPPVQARMAGATPCGEIRRSVRR